MRMDMKVVEKRRREVMQEMGGGVAILPTAPTRSRSRDVNFPFRPDSDFYYLTQFPEPNVVAVLVPGRAHGEYLLFCREKDPEKEIWDGRRAGLEGAREIYGADDAFPIDDIDEILPGLLENCDKVFYSMGRDQEFDNRLMGWVNEIRAKARAGVKAPGEFVDLNHILHEMRLYKRPEEIRLMKRAAKVSTRAHKRAMQACRPGMMEYELEAELLFEFTRAGSLAPAYPPIIGGGPNSCILHYTQNDAELKDGDVQMAAIRLGDDGGDGFACGRQDRVAVAVVRVAADTDRVAGVIVPFKTRAVGGSACIVWLCPHFKCMEPFHQC